MMTGDTSHPDTGVQGSGPRRRLARETPKVAPFGLRLAATAIALALATTYAAADGIPGVVMTDSQYLTDWSGIYIGGKLGGTWSDLNWQTDANVFSTGAGAAAAANTPIDFSPSGIIGGIIGGANLQLGQWIFGAELSFSGTGLSQTTTSPFFPATDTFSTKLNWLLTVEGRIGYTWDRVMVFGKGGWAGSNATLKVNSSPPPMAARLRSPSSSRAGPSAAASNTQSGTASSSVSSTTTCSLNLTRGGDCRSVRRGAHDRQYPFRG